MGFRLHLKVINLSYKIQSFYYELQDESKTKDYRPATSSFLGECS